MKNIEIKPAKLAICILIPLAVGQLSALLTGSSREVYASLLKPPASPPAYLFPIIWTLLYILMGISSYLVLISGNDNTKTALIWYAIQLIFNFCWSLLFFNLNDYFISFIWLLVLIVLIEIMIWEFSKINLLAAYLQIPYLVWCIYAAYLNFSIYQLNK